MWYTPEYPFGCRSCTYTVPELGHHYSKKFVRKGDRWQFLDYNALQYSLSIRRHYSKWPTGTPEESRPFASNYVSFRIGKIVPVYPVTRLKVPLTVLLLVGVSWKLLNKFCCGNPIGNCKMAITKSAIKQARVSTIYLQLHHVWRQPGFSPPVMRETSVDLD